MSGEPKPPMPAWKRWVLDALVSLAFSAMMSVGLYFTFIGLCGASQLQYHLGVAAMIVGGVGMIYWRIHRFFRDQKRSEGGTDDAG